MDRKVGTSFVIEGRTYTVKRDYEETPFSACALCDLKGNKCGKLQIYRGGCWKSNRADHLSVYFVDTTESLVVRVFNRLFRRK